jgi:hypothetical protein
MDDLNMRPILEGGLAVILVFSEFMWRRRAIDSSIEIWVLD